MIIYFDNAATSWPKPKGVAEAMSRFIEEVGGSPGRSGHRRSLAAGRLVYETREKLARLFNARDPEEIVFTLNATDGLNMALKGLLEEGDHVIISSLEHNSIVRPLMGLQAERHVKVTEVPCSPEGDLDLEALEKAIEPSTRLIALTHASNVIGTIMPVKEVAQIAHSHGVKLLVDAAQTAGVVPLDVRDMNIDLLAFTGHKGLLGPPGIGGLYVRRGVTLKPWREGGTGSRSEEDHQPSYMPDYLEAGTPNTPGIAGLREALSFIERQGVERIREYEEQLTGKLLEGLSILPRVQIYGPRDPSRMVATVSFNIKGVDCGEVGYLLDQGFGIMVRPGLHCAPRAHRTIGTFPSGTVRFSLGYFNTAEEVDRVINALEQIIEEFL